MAANYMDYPRLVQKIENLHKGSTIDSTKIADFFIAYVCGNSVAKSADIAQVNVNTAKSWSQKSWYTEVMEAARSVAGQKVDRKLSKIIDLALDNLETRLIKGDPFKNGQDVDYKPVSARDSALIAAITYDKRALSRGEPTNIGADISLEERLDKLKEKFENISKESNVRRIK